MEPNAMLNKPWYVQSRKHLSQYSSTSMERERLQMGHCRLQWEHFQPLSSCLPHSQMGAVLLSCSSPSLLSSSSSDGWWWWWFVSSLGCWSSDDDGAWLKSSSSSGDGVSEVMADNVDALLLLLLPSMFFVRVSLLLNVIILMTYSIIPGHGRSFPLIL